jgi:hypothetical protein
MLRICRLTCDQAANLLLAEFHQAKSAPAKFPCRAGFFEKSQTELVHRWRSRSENAVNNSHSRIGNRIDLTG